MQFFKKRLREQNRRGAKRSAPEHQIARARVLFDGGAALDVKVLDSSGSGARLEWSSSLGPRPEPESHLVLSIEMAGCDLVHRIHAHVARSSESEQRVGLGLDFCDPVRDLAALRDIDRPFFDRRKHARLKIEEEAWVDLALGPIRLCGNLHDLSLGGLAMRLAPHLAGNVTIGERGYLHLRLPGDYQDICIKAELRNREDRPDGTRLGLAFTSEPEDWFDRIEEFLNSRNTALS